MIELFRQIQGAVPREIAIGEDNIDYVKGEVLQRHPRRRRLLGIEAVCGDDLRPQTDLSRVLRNNQNPQPPLRIGRTGLETGRRLRSRQSF